MASHSTAKVADFGIPQPSSEFQRESEAVTYQLDRLGNLLDNLHARLHPVLPESITGSGSAKGEQPPASPLGHQLREYSGRIGASADQVEGLLSSLVLP
jgi:hypothetical protein